MADFYKNNPSGFKGCESCLTGLINSLKLIGQFSSDVINFLK